MTLFILHYRRTVDELLRRALLYRKSATTAVVLHVERDLHEHATRAAHARDCIRRTRVTTPPTKTYE